MLATQLDEAYRDAELKINVTLENPGPAADSGLSLDICADGARRHVLLSHSAPRLALETLEPGTKAVELVAHVDNPLKWSAEKPHLYRLALQLKRDGQLLESIERNIGFREIEVRGSELLINGVPVKFAGACRHETDPLSGRADTMRHAEQDVQLIKAANLNYIRTSHYPPTMELVDAADRHGMYLEVEAPFCWVGVQEDLQHAPRSSAADLGHDRLLSHASERDRLVAGQRVPLQSLFRDFPRPGQAAGPHARDDVQQSRSRSASATSPISTTRRCPTTSW